MIKAPEKKSRKPIVGSAKIKSPELIDFEDSALDGAKIEEFTPNKVSRKFLYRAKVEDDVKEASPPLADDGFFDSPSKSLNAKYPVMGEPVMAPPGTLPATPLVVQKVATNEPSWREIGFLVCMASVVVCAFFTILFTGLRDVVRYIMAMIEQFFGLFMSD